jgi:cysteine-rich repeat protein
MHINFLRALIIPNKVLLVVLLFPILLILMSQKSYAQICGDGILDVPEACDDGNTVSDDGCSGDCLSIEPGFECVTPGDPCIPVTCGNNVLEGIETCDDGNNMSGDGCSSACQLECGNGVLDGAEVCDDGNTLSGDGCSNDCSTIQPGYVCPVPGEPCMQGACGDGIVTSPEECDDGNDSPGDGCSATCQLEVAHNVPALSLWGLLALAGVLGIIGLMVIRRRKLRA